MNRSEEVEVTKVILLMLGALIILWVGAIVVEAL